MESAPLRPTLATLETLLKQNLDGNGRRSIPRHDVRAVETGFSQGFRHKQWASSEVLSAPRDRSVNLPIMESAPLRPAT